MSSVEFYVRSVQKDASGSDVVVGMPNNRVPLKVGDRFTIKYEIAREDILNGTPNPTRINAAAVDLIVERIDSMRKFVDELPPGVTGALYLSGEGSRDVAAAMFLRTSEGHQRS